MLLIIMSILIVGVIFWVDKYAGNIENDSSISDPRIREMIKDLQEEAESKTIFDFFSSIDFNSIPDGTFKETTGKNKKGVEVREYCKKLDDTVMDLFDELEIQIDGNKKHYLFSGYHAKPPIKALRNTANAFYFKYGANVDGIDVFNEKDENIIFKGYLWRSVWNIIREEKKAFSLAWYSNEKKAKITIMDFSDNC